MTVPLPAFIPSTAAAEVPSRTIRHALGAAFRPDAGTVKTASGVLAGPSQSQGEVTLTSQTNLRVRPFLAVVQGTQTADQGPYVIPNETDRNFTPPAKDATQTRRCLVVVRADETTGTGYLELLSGALAPSAPSLPALPANAVALGEMTVANASGTSTATWYSRLTVARGGILPVTAGDTTAGSYVGQYRDHPTLGLQRWDGTGWRTDGRGWLGAGSGADSGTDHTNKTAAIVYVTVPAGLPTNRRILLTGQVHVTSPSGVGAVITIGGESRPINQGSLNSDFSIAYADPDLTPGARDFRLLVRSTVNGGDITYKSARIQAQII